MGGSGSMPLRDDGHMTEWMIQVTSSPGDVAIREAACIWARATARRDGTSPPANVDAAEAGVRRRLALQNAALLTARQDERVVAFALVAPRTETLELFHLVVDPGAWGHGLATELLRAVDAQAHQVGRANLELWVIDDNERAAAVYERAGWTSTDRTERDAISGRIERRFVRHLFKET